MKILRNLVLADTVLLITLGLGIALVYPHSLPVVYPEGRLYQEMATLRLLGTALGGLAFVLLALNSLSLVADFRRLALLLSVANGMVAMMALTQQNVIWGSMVGELLVPIFLTMTVSLAWASRRPLKPEEVTAELEMLTLPEEIRQALLRQVGDAAAQEERNRLARDLHDSIKQQLFSINVGTATAQERWDVDPEGARTALADVRLAAREAMVEMQALLHQLRPQALSSTAGLIGALREQCEALGYRTGAEVLLELGEAIPDDRLPPGTQETLFRIAQEALANVARHARARTVRLWIGREGEAVLLRIADDGQGFVLGNCSPGMGLRNMKERMESLHGALDVATAPGKGTTITARVPLVSLAARDKLPIDKAIDAEVRELPSVLVLGALCVLGLFGGQQLDTGVFAVLSFSGMAAWSWERGRSALRASPASPAAVSHLRIVGHRSRAFELLFASWWPIWYRVLPAEAWNPGLSAWATLALLCMALAGFELLCFHRQTRLRRKPLVLDGKMLTGVVRWTGFPLSLGILMLLVFRQNLVPLKTLQILYLSLAAGVGAYVLARQPGPSGARR